jgi:SAP domain-containing ribonucleoprotein
VSTTTQQTPAAKEGSGFKFNPIVFDKQPTNTSPTPTPSADTKSTNGNTETSAATTDAERKLERAKRFGVKVDEKTKQELRAARFGIQKASSPTPAKKASPVQKKAAPKVR